MEFEETSSKWEPVPNEFHGCLLNDVHIVAIREFSEQDRLRMDSIKKGLRKGILKIQLICAGICLAVALIAIVSVRPDPQNYIIGVVGIFVLSLLFVVPFGWLFWNDKAKVIKLWNRISIDQCVLGFPVDPDELRPDGSFGFDLGASSQSRALLQVSWPSSFLFQVEQDWIDPVAVNLEYVSVVPEQARMSAEFASTIGPDFVPQFRSLSTGEFTEILAICGAESRAIIGTSIPAIYLLIQGIRFWVNAPFNVGASHTGIAAAMFVAAIFFGKSIPARSLFVWRLKQDMKAGYLTIFRDPDENRVIEMLIHSKLIWSVDLEPSRFRREPFKFRIPFKNPTGGSRADSRE